jgi:hypothetical protein
MTGPGLQIGNLHKGYYLKIIQFYRPDYRERILNGEYPAHLAENGEYRIVWLKEEELSTYSIFNCPDEHFFERKTGEYFGWPIIHNPNTDCGIIAKKEDGRPPHLHLSYPDWSDWNNL